MSFNFTKFFEPTSNDINNKIEQKKAHDIIDMNGCDQYINEFFSNILTSNYSFYNIGKKSTIQCKKNIIESLENLKNENSIQYIRYTPNEFNEIIKDNIYHQNNKYFYEVLKNRCMCDKSYILKVKQNNYNVKFLAKQTQQ